MTEPVVPDAENTEETPEVRAATHQVGLGLELEL